MESLRDQSALSVFTHCAIVMYLDGGKSVNKDDKKGRTFEVSAPDVPPSHIHTEGLEIQLTSKSMAILHMYVLCCHQC